MLLCPSGKVKIQKQCSCSRGSVGCAPIAQQQLSRNLHRRDLSEAGRSGSSVDLEMDRAAGSCPGLRSISGLTRRGFEGAQLRRCGNKPAFREQVYPKGNIRGFRISIPFEQRLARDLRHLVCPSAWYRPALLSVCSKICGVTWLRSDREKERGSVDPIQFSDRSHESCH